MHVAEQMGVVLCQTASSVNIKERLDYSCALFDADANLVANAPHMPVHLGSMGASVAAVLESHGADLRPGDAFLLNSPYHGGTHLPDMTVVTPVFDAAGERVHFFTASRAHHADVGGITPGSMPPGSRDIDEEGVLIEPVRIVRDGVFAERHRASVARRIPLAGPQPRAEPRGPARAARVQCARHPRARARRGDARLAAAARLHGPRAGQRRGVHAPGHPPAAGRPLPLRDGQRPAGRGGASAWTARPAPPRWTSRAPRRSSPTTSMRRAPSPWPPCSTCSARWWTSRSRSTPAACGRSTIVVPPGSMLDPPLARRGGGRQRRDLAVRRGRAVRRARAAGGRAGHDEQLHLRQRALPVLRDHRGRVGRRPGLPRRERRADAHDQLAADRPGGARAPLPGAAAGVLAARGLRRHGRVPRRRRAGARDRVP